MTGTPFSVGRREFLHRAGAAIGAGATVPLLGSATASAVPAADPDELFWLGRFDEADRAYANLLRTDQDNAHAWAQRGYIALLSNRFPNAESFLTTAVRLAPDDDVSRKRLADVYVRQDQLARAVPLLGDSPVATQYAAVSGTPYTVHGAQSTRVPWVALNPLPTLEASLNGGPPGQFLLDTGATSVSLTTKAAADAGLEAVATTSAQVGDGLPPITAYLGVLPSFRMGEIELRNFPVMWSDGGVSAIRADQQPSGVIGSKLLYHFLTTIDYANRALVLRRKTDAQLREFRAQAGHARRLPLWVAGDHLLCTLGTIQREGPRMVVIDTGGIGSTCVQMPEDVARRAGVKPDHGRPETINHKTVYPCFPRVGLGDTADQTVYGAVSQSWKWSEQFQFETIANVTHSFLKPFTITFDFVEMGCYLMSP